MHIEKQCAQRIYKDQGILFNQMKNKDINFVEGQIVLANNIIAEVKEVRELTLLLELSGNRGITEYAKSKVHLITFGMEFF